MASSSYYYGRYKYYKGEESKYKKQASSLKKVLDAITSYTIKTDAKDVTNKVDNVREKMQEAVQNANYAYTNNQELLWDYREQQGTEDAKLSTAYTAINNEKKAVEQKQANSKASKDHYWDLYIDALKQEAIDAVTGG